MTTLIAGLLVFFIPHFFSAFRSRSSGKDLKRKMGYGPFMGLYSLVSAIGLGLMIYGYMITGPTNLIYIGPEWSRAASGPLMFAAFVLLVSAYIPQTHFKSIVRHPMLSAVILWSAAHLLIGADVKKLLLFGSFLVFAIVDFVAASLRPSDAEGSSASLSDDLIALILGGGAYAAVVYWGHEAAFGISPII